MERRVKTLFTEAVDALEKSSLNSDAHHALGELATYVAYRDR